MPSYSLAHMPNAGSGAIRVPGTAACIWWDRFSTLAAVCLALAGNGAAYVRGLEDRFREATANALIGAAAAAAHRTHGSVAGASAQAAIHRPHAGFLRL